MGKYHTILNKLVVFNPKTTSQKDFAGKYLYIIDISYFWFRIETKE